MFLSCFCCWFVVVVVGLIVCLFGYLSFGGVFVLFCLLFILFVRLIPAHKYELKGSFVYLLIEKRILIKFC